MTGARVAAPAPHRRAGDAGVRPASLARLAAPVRFERLPLRLPLSAREVLRALSDEPGAFALTGDWAGGGAIVGASPVLVADPGADPFATVDALPPVMNIGELDASAVGGGWFGWFGYRLGGRIERLPPGPPRPMPLPEFSLAYYDHVLRLDGSGRWWLESLASDERADALERRRRQLIGRLEHHAVAHEPYTPPEPLALSHAAAAHHLAAVRECRERIAAGEIYQANICLRLETSWYGEASALFEHALDRIAPPHAALFATPWGGIASLSPELFLRRRGTSVMTAPIKGTIRRDRDAALSEAALAELRGSAKDAAEHVMIVDLMRNDLGRVCEYGTIHAPRVPDAEQHPGLWHLVSRVHGRLRPEAGNGDLLRATFPPGSVTGAPKVQAMHVIAELERTGREGYTGAIGFVSPIAGLELNVAIRTLELCHGRLWLGVGGGIVADSDPQRELEEALLKARPIAAAIGTTVSTAARPAPSPAPRASPDPAQGVFETLLVRDGRAQALSRHVERLAGAVADLYGARLPADLPARVRAAVGPLAGAHRLRVNAVPGPEGVRTEIDSEPLALPDADRPIQCKPLSLDGGIGAYKWRDRRVLERHDDGHSVALIVDRGELLEAAWANLWIVEDRSIVTPPADGRLLAGVTRGLLLELAEPLGLVAATEPISLSRARDADAIFLTSSLRHAVGALLGDAGDRGTEASTAAEHPRRAASAIIRTIRAALSAAGWGP